ncbi:MAG: YHS domain-containing protein [Candidatus Aminicenantes bacterium]|nr:MAG: YHS domain-containing protein [Candidatus Aminicenantes bacterium]
MFYYDPVCGKKINRSKAHVRLKYEDEIYYLCCPKCQAEFEKDPKNYLLKGKHKRRKQY